MRERRLALSPQEEARLDALQERINVRFRRPELLREAMTHASWNNERGGPSGPGYDNERLEYLGDAVLELVVGEYLFRRFPEYDEGQLTQLRAALVNTVSLARLAEKLGLGDSLLVGRGAAKTGANKLPSLLANAFEAMIGAVFLDHGYRVATRLFLHNVGDVADWSDQNFKGRLQQVAQERTGNAPVYRVDAVSGPGHKREYAAEVLIGGEVTGSGRGATKQSAEQEAARTALEALSRPSRRRRGATRPVRPVALESPRDEPGGRGSSRPPRGTAAAGRSGGAARPPQVPPPTPAASPPAPPRRRRGLFAALRTAAEALGLPVAGAGAEPAPSATGPPTAGAGAAGAGPAPAAVVPPPVIAVSEAPPAGGGAPPAARAPTARGDRRRSSAPERRSEQTEPSQPSPRSASAGGEAGATDATPSGGRRTRRGRRGGRGRRSPKAPAGSRPDGADAVGEPAGGASEAAATPRRRPRRRRSGTRPSPGAPGADTQDVVPHAEPEHNILTA